MVSCRQASAASRRMKLQRPAHSLLLLASAVLLCSMNQSAAFRLPFKQSKAAWQPKIQGAFKQTQQQVQSLIGSSLLQMLRDRQDRHVGFLRPLNRRILDETKPESAEGTSAGDVSTLGRVREMERELTEVEVLSPETQNPSNSTSQQAVPAPSGADVSNCTAEDRGKGDGRCCDDALRGRLHGHLHNVVLIMHVNYPWVARQLAPFWRRVYGPIFDNIVFVSSREIPELGVQSRGPLYSRDDWRTQFWCLPKIMAQFPEAEGFLWTNDDVIVNYWKLLDADKTKFWLPNDPSNSETRHFPFDENAPVMNEEDNSTPESRKKARQAYNLLDEAYKLKLDNASKPNEGHFQKRICDVFYVPRRHVEALSFDLIPAFREARVNSEVAIPTMFYAIDHPDNFDHVLDDMVYRWDHWSNNPQEVQVYDPLRYWNKGISALHPFKLSKPDMQVKLIQSLRQGDSCVCREFPESCAQDK